MNICLICHKYGVPLDDPCCYPLGFMYVSARLKKMGHTVKVLNYNLFDYDLREELYGQDLAMFTGFEEFLPKIIVHAGIAKKMGIRTALGGALATFKTKDMKRYVDKVVPGEMDTRGILPDYDGFGIEEYHRRHSMRYMGVLTSFGCPYSCTFCSSVCKFSYRPLADVFDEILWYRMKHDIEMVIFNDNTLNFSKKRFMEICGNMQIKWGAAIRADIFDEEMARAAKNSGASYFVIGVESFKQEKLDRMNKKMKVSDIIRCLDLCHKYDIGYHGNILVGFEGETKEEIEKEIAEIPSGYNVFPTMVQPFIGTLDGKKRAMTREDEIQMAADFLAKVHEKGMYQYPALEWA